VPAVPMEYFRRPRCVACERSLHNNIHVYEVENDWSSMRMLRSALHISHITRTKVMFSVIMELVAGLCVPYNGSLQCNQVVFLLAVYKYKYTKMRSKTKNSIKESYARSEMIAWPRYYSHKHCLYNFQTSAYWSCSEQ